MRCWIICLFLALVVSAHSKFGAFRTKSPQYRHDDLPNGHVDNLLQRRGDSSKPRKSGKDGKPPLSPKRSETKGAAVLPPRTQSSQQLESQGSPSKKTYSSPFVPSLRGTLDPFTAAFYPSESSWLKATQPDRLPYAPPPRAPFSMPPGHQPPTPGSPNRKHLTIKRGSKDMPKSPTSPTDPSSELNKLRISSGATQTSSDIEASPRTPSATSPSPPRDGTAPEKQPTSPGSKASPSRRPPSPPRQPSPPKQSLDIDPGVPTAHGISWLPEQKRITEAWKARALVEQSTRDMLEVTAGKADLDKSLAKTARRLDNEDIRKARHAMSTGKVMDKEVMHAVGRSKESTAKAQVLTFAYSQSEGQAAEMYQENDQYIEGVKHHQKANRAFARHEMIMQHGQALDYKYINQGIKEGIDKNKSEGIPPSPLMISKAVKLRRTYKAAAEGYHKTWRNWQKVRQDFDGSSSDESEKSTFDDVVPKEERLAKHANIAQET